MNVALPVVIRHFGASATQASWLILSYLLVTTVFTLVFGRWADVLGRRRLYLSGLVTFTAASLAAGMAPTADLLIALRVLQAVGAAAVITNTTALLADAFPAQSLGIALGLNVTVISAAQVLGPLVGGLAATLTGWRGVFWFNVPLGIVCIVWTARTLRRAPPTRLRERFDVIGALLSLCVIGAAVAALSQGGALGWGAPVVLACAAAFLVSAPTFFWWQRRTPFALIDVSVVADRARALAYVSVFMVAACRGAVVLVITLYVQSARGGDALDAGLQVLPMAGGIMLVAPVVGVLNSRLHSQVMPVIGCALMTCGLLALGWLLSPTVGDAAIASALFAVGAGSGIASVPTASFITATAPTARLGVANGLRLMLVNTGYVIGTALCLGIATSALRPGDKAAAYAGDGSLLSESSLAAFTGTCRAAVFVLAGLGALGALASIMRRTHGDSRRPTQAPGSPITTARE